MTCCQGWPRTSAVSAHETDPQKSMYLALVSEATFREACSCRPVKSRTNDLIAVVMMTEQDDICA